MRTWLKKQIAELEALCQQTKATHEDAVSRIQKAADKGEQVGHLDFYHEYKDVQAITPRDAIGVLSSYCTRSRSGMTS
mgnify:FL=1